MDGPYAEQMWTALRKVLAVRSLLTELVEATWDGHCKAREIGRKHDVESICAELCRLQNAAKDFRKELRAGTFPLRQLINDLRQAVAKKGASYTDLEEINDLDYQVREQNSTAAAGAELASKLEAVAERIEAFAIDLIDGDRWLDATEGKQRESGFHLIGLAWALQDHAALLPQ